MVQVKNNLGEKKKRKRKKKKKKIEEKLKAAATGTKKKCQASHSLARVSPEPQFQDS